MDFYKVPMGFGMALSRNPSAMNAYSAMSEEEKREIVSRARGARSEQEMQQIANSLAGYRGQ